MSSVVEDPGGWTEGHSHISDQQSTYYTPVLCHDIIYFFRVKLSKTYVVNISILYRFLDCLLLIVNECHDIIARDIMTTI